MSANYEKKPGSRVEDNPEGMHRVTVFRDDSQGKGYFPEQILKQKGYVLKEGSDGFETHWEAPDSVANKHIEAAADKSEKRLNEMDALDTSGLPVNADVRQVKNSVTILKDADAE